MRWDDLFADLESQASEADRLALEAEVDERVRGEVGRIALGDRLRAGIGRHVSVSCPARVVVVGRLASVGSEWLLIEEDAPHETVVPLWSVLAVSGLSRIASSADAVSEVDRRLGIRQVLRAIARDRSGVRIHLQNGQILTGTIDRVGADFLDLAEHPQAEPRRRNDVRRVTAVPYAALVAVRRDG